MATEAACATDGRYCNKGHPPRTDTYNLSNCVTDIVPSSRWPVVQPVDLDGANGARSSGKGYLRHSQTKEQRDVFPKAAMIPTPLSFRSA